MAVTVPKPSAERLVARFQVGRVDRRRAEQHRADVFDSSALEGRVAQQPPEAGRRHEESRAGIEAQQIGEFAGRKSPTRRQHLMRRLGDMREAEQAGRVALRGKVEVRIAGESASTSARIEHRHRHRGCGGSASRPSGALLCRWCRRARRGPPRRSAIAIGSAAASASPIVVAEHDQARLSGQVRARDLGEVPRRQAQLGGAILGNERDFARMQLGVDGRGDEAGPPDRKQAARYSALLVIASTTRSPGARPSSARSRRRAERRARHRPRSRRGAGRRPRPRANRESSAPRRSEGARFCKVHQSGSFQDRDRDRGLLDAAQAAAVFDKRRCGRPRPAAARPRRAIARRVSNTCPSPVAPIGCPSTRGRPKG